MKFILEATALEQCGEILVGWKQTFLVATGQKEIRRGPRIGNHAFRRFRNTYLRNYTECPQGLYKYWMGHAGEDMSDLCDKIKEDVAFRRKWAERCGFGFELPSVVPNVPKIAQKAEAAKAA